MFKKILALTVCSLTASSAFALAPTMLSSEKQRAYAYRALTYIAATDTPPPTSKAVAIDQLKNNSQDVLAELCYYAGALQLRLNNVFTIHPQAMQSPNPLREQMQVLVEKGQQSLRTACAVNEDNKKLSTLQKVTNVQNAISEITTEAINLRNTVSYRH